MTRCLPRVGYSWEPADIQVRVHDWCVIHSCHDTDKDPCFDFVFIAPEGFTTMMANEGLQKEEPV